MQAEGCAWPDICMPKVLLAARKGTCAAYASMLGP